MRGMQFLRGTALTAALLASVPASAAWLKATTRHFVIYADEKPEAITARATDLELVDSALRLLHHTDEAEGAEANPLTIYVVADQNALLRVYGNPNSNVAGFYLPRSAGAVAYTPARGDMDNGRTDLSPRTVLFHEYAHHFLLGNYAMAYPAWFTEGYAEFVSTLKLEPERVLFGAAALHRASSLFANDGLTLRRVLAPPARMDLSETLSIYARGWLLTHYLLLDPERSRQFDRYLSAVNAGTPSLTAAEQTFGDLRALDRKLGSYMMQPRLPARGIPRSALPTVKVDVRPLSAGAAAMMQSRMLSARGVNAKRSADVFAVGSKVAAQFPDDPTVQGWFAEMAYDAGRDDVADQAADRALARDPNMSQALLYKARILMRRAGKTPADPSGWRAARSFVVRANKFSADNAPALALYYATYAASGQQPTENAVAALVRAQQLLPQAPDLRFTLVRHYILAGKIDDARRTLLPLAYDPHGGPDSFARKLLDAIDTKADAKTLAAMFSAREKKDGDTTPD